MNETILQFERLVGLHESEELEYKAVLPPSRAIAQLVSGFANNKGGTIILGASETPHGVEVKGLSEDFHANAITHKALDLLSPQPEIEYHYFTHNGKKLYGIKVKPSLQPVMLEGKYYVRTGAQTSEQGAAKATFTKKYPDIQKFSDELAGYHQLGTSSKHKLLDHYQSVLKIIDDLASILYPQSPGIPTANKEGKILCRILFSSFVDNFETYLSDLLFEIYLAKPQTLKSKQQVTVEEVLNCSDIQDFVRYWAKQKLLKLQKGSVKGFIVDNKQISELAVLNNSMIERIDGILQIRHLYAHRAGIVDEAFLQYFPDFELNIEHAMSIVTICDHMMYLAKIVNNLDDEAIKKFDLAVI